jgi:zinc transporter ZupT
VLTVRFGTELALLAVLAVAGASAPAPLAVRVILAVAGPVLAAVLWGMMIGPRARRRPSDPLRITIEIVLFLVAAALLALAGYAFWAVIFAVAAIGVAALVRVTAPGA